MKYSETLTKTCSITNVLHVTKGIKLKRLLRLQGIDRQGAGAMKNKPQGPGRMAVIGLIVYLEPGGFYDTNNLCFSVWRADIYYSLDTTSYSHY